MKEQIQKILEGMQRYREHSLEEKFNQEQRDFINSYPSSESFKVKMFRSIGYGKCKTCGSNTEYQHASYFKVYCSNSCSSQYKRPGRFVELYANE